MKICYKCKKSINEGERYYKINRQILTIFQTVYDKILDPEFCSIECLCTYRYFDIYTNKGDE